MELMVPATLRNVPQTTSSASIWEPSALLLPRARSWSPARIASRGAGCASAKRTDPGAYRLSEVALEVFIVTVFTVGPAPVVTVIDPDEGSTLFTRPATARFCQ